MAVSAFQEASSNTQPLTWSNALQLLEQSSPTPTLSSFLTDSLAQLQDPANAFPSANTQNTSTALTTTTEAGGQLTKSQETAVTEVGERFKIGKGTAEAAVKTCTRRLRQEDGRVSEDEWESVTAWVFEQRMSIIGTVTLLLRIHDDEGHPCYSLAAELIPSILTPTFPSTILSSLAGRTQQQLPTPVRRSSTLAKYWTTQLVLEEKALLELLFLVYYSPTFQLEGSHVVRVFETVLKGKWGSQQELMGYMDQETQLVSQELAHLYSILAIEVLNLEVIMEQSNSPYPIPAPGESPLPLSSPFHPSHLASLSSTVESLVQLNPEQASPILLGWAFVTSKITSSLLERGVPTEYHEFAKASLKVETGSGGPNSQQPLFQLYTSHALSTSSNLFPNLLSMLKSSLFGYSRASDSYSSSASSDPNTIGYLSVIRGLLLTLPHLVRLPFLNETQLSGLFETFSAVYSNPSSTILCAQFWQNLQREQASADLSVLLEDHSAQNEAEKEIIELARSRFPVQFGPFVRLVRSLSAGLISLTTSTHSHNIDEEELASTCSRTAFAYLASLPTLTHVLPSTTPSPYESLSYPDPETGYSVRCTRAIQVSPSLSIKEGTMGRLVSPPGRKPLVVSWDVASGWSAWKLIGDLIIGFAGSGRKKGNDVFGNGAEGEGDHPVAWESITEKENDLVDAMELLKLVLKGDPSLGSTVLDHLSSSATNSSRPDLIEALFKILDRSLGLASIPTRLVSSLVELIAALLPSFPGVVWTFLRGSPQLFPNSTGSQLGSRFQGGGNAYTNILSSEKIAGRYPITLSLLTLVHSLVLESQVASRVVSPEYSAIKQGVLVRALNWVKDEVWSAHLNWRYSGLGQKFELAKKMVDVFGLVVEEGELESGLEKGNFSSPVKVVTDTFLSNSSSAGIAQLAPLLSTFTFGSSSIETLHRAGRYHDALILEDLVESALRLTLQLLRLRSLIRGSSSSLLEKLLLSSNPSVNLSLSSSFTPSSSFARSPGSSSRPELLECLVSFVISPLSSTIAVQAAKVVTLLTVLSATSISQDQTGLVPLLGGSDKARETVVALLSIVGDSTGLVEVHVAVWDLLSAIVESQTGLAMLVVTGSQHTALDLSLTTTSDKGKEKEQPQSSPLPRPSLGKPLTKTALEIVIDKLGTWKSSCGNEPEVLASILRFLDYVWQHLSDYAEAINEMKKKPELWKGLVEIAFEEAGAEPIEGDEVEPYCHRLMAKSHALRTLVLDVEYSIDKLGPKAQDSSSFANFVVSFKDKKKLLTALTAAIDSSCDPDLHQDVHELIRTSFPDLELTSLRLPPSAHPLDRSRTFGTSYIYSLPLLRRHLDGYLAQENDGEQSMIGHDAFSDVVEQTARLNCNFSLLEAQMLGTTSWRQALETLLPLVRKDAAVQGAVGGCITDIAKQVAQEDRGGQVMQTLHSERLEILLSLVEILHTSSSPETKTTSIALVGELCSIFSNSALDLNGSLSRKTKPSFHSPLLRIAFFLSSQINSMFSTPSSLQSLSHEDKTQLNTQVASILRILLSSLRELFLLARASKTFDIEQDLSLSIALLSRLLNSPFSPPPALWLAQCHSLDLFRTALAVFISTNNFDPSLALYAPLVLDFCLLVANSSPQAAEQIALDGVMTALTNNALTEAAESGAISITSSVDGSQTTQHRIWTSMLALVVSLVSALGDSTRFIEQDVTGFARLYGSQIARALSWNADSSITTVGLEELALVVALLQGMAKSSSRGGASSLSTSVTAAFIEQTLHLLQHLVYALLHPNHLSSSIEGTTPEERNSIEKEANESESSSKPISEAVNLAILRLAQNIVGTLIDFTDAWSMLIKEATEWRSENAIILPTATVTANEKTSIGTLLDMISHCTDVLRANPTSTSPSSSISTSFPTLPSPSPSASRTAASDTLEGCLLLATTQLGLYGMIGSGPQQGQRGASFTRTLTELSTELAESIDKATGAEGGKGDSGRLLALLKARLASWL